MNPRPFFLVVDSASPDEPRPRRFGSLDAALKAYDELDEAWQRFAWITEQRHFGVTVVYMRDGVRT